jgi:hypothetical protein
VILQSYSTWRRHTARSLLESTSDIAELLLMNRLCEKRRLLRLVVGSRFSPILSVHSYTLLLSPRILLVGLALRPRPWFLVKTLYSYIEKVRTSTSPSAY